MARTPARIRLLAPVALAAALAPGSARAEPPRWNLALASGAEYDTNIHHCERGRADCSIEAAPLARSTARLLLGWQPRPDHSLQLLGFGGAKLFASGPGQSENLSVMAGQAHYRWELPARRTALGLRAAYYDTFGYALAEPPQQAARRDFAMASGELHVDLSSAAGHRLSMIAGYRSFRYKPDPDLDWHGDHYGARYRTALWLGSDTDISVASLELRVSYGVERRHHRGLALRNGCGATDDPQCLRAIDLQRTDLHHEAGAEVVYTGDRIYSARYRLEVVDSNSAGPYAQVRHRLELGVTTELFAELFATAEAALQVIGYRDPLLLTGGGVAAPDPTADFVAINDENRSALSVHLVRDLDAAWSIEARYALHTGALATPELGFRRQLFYTGVAYRYEP